MRTACINFASLQVRFCLWKCQRRPVFYIPVMNFSLYVTFWLSFYAAKRILWCLIQAWIISSIWHNNAMILWRGQTLKSIILMFIFWGQLRHKCERPPGPPPLSSPPTGPPSARSTDAPTVRVWCTAKNICRMYGLLKGHKTHAERERRPTLAAWAVIQRSAARGQKWSACFQAELNQKIREMMDAKENNG